MIATRTSLLVSVFLFSIAANATTFGSYGRDGSSGYDGSDGRDGVSISIRADGTAANHDLSGGNGTSGQPGQRGQDASSCSQPQPNYNLEGAGGGDGGRGGSGGSGGNGGAVKVYYEDITNVGRIFIRNYGGQAGYGTWGAQGGQGCRCQIYTWKTAGSETIYTCRDGNRGWDGASGSTGRNGSYGQLYLISQLGEVKSERPTVTIDMSKMEAGPFAISKNHWEARTGARALFAPGSDIVDKYTLFTGRTEVNYGFRWEATRPITDFTGWRMTLQLEGTTPKLYLPNNLWADSETVIEATGPVHVFHAVVMSSEIGKLKFGSFQGVGEDHTVVVNDSAGMSATLKTSVEMEYFTKANGRYQQRFKGAVPESVLETSAGGFKIPVAKLGVAADYLKADTPAYVGLVITRALGGESLKYKLGDYYRIKTPSP